MRNDYYFLTVIKSDFIDYLKKNGIIEYEIITYKNLKSGEYDCPGVWALFGIKKGSKEWCCLQVGQTKKISKEIKKDIRIMKSGRSELMQPYVNQWGEKLFEHPTHFVTAGLWAYTDIPKKYSQFKWLKISGEKDINIQKDIERSFAEKYKPIYWRNGRSTKELVSDD